MVMAGATPGTDTDATGDSYSRAGMTIAGGREDEGWGTGAWT